MKSIFKRSVQRLALLTSVSVSAVLVSAAHAAVFVSVTVAPPLLPVYAQPPIPAEGYIWTPGHWAWNPDLGDYYWVQGAWVLPPYTGALWTPGYWVWRGAAYHWCPGYWGRTVGYYGGINYGYGYFGSGYEGGYWHHGSFMYNRSVNNIHINNITNVYNAPVTGAGMPSATNRASFSGGTGGQRDAYIGHNRAIAGAPHVSLPSGSPVAVQHEQNFGHINHSERTSGTWSGTSSNTRGPGYSNAVAVTSDFRPRDTYAMQASGNPARWPGGTPYHTHMTYSGHSVQTGNLPLRGAGGRAHGNHGSRHR